MTESDPSTVLPRLTELEKRVTKLEGPPADALTVRELLSPWPGENSRSSMRSLAQRIRVSEATMTRFLHAKAKHFPTVLAAKCVSQFQRHHISVFGESLTTDRLRQAWLREKGKADD